MLEKGLQRAKEELDDAWADAWNSINWSKYYPDIDMGELKIGMKEILKDARQTKLRRRVKDDLSDPMTTSTRVSTRYKEDVEYLKDHFNEYEIEVKETACGWSVQVTHQIKTPLQQRCEELQKRLNDRTVYTSTSVRNIAVSPYKMSEDICVTFHAGICSVGRTIKRGFFDDHTVEELAAAIEGLYFA